MKKLLLHSVSIVLPNWNGVELLKKNLPSVIEACSNCEIIVADDASADDSVSFLHEPGRNFPVRKFSAYTVVGFVALLLAGCGGAPKEDAQGGESSAAADSAKVLRININAEVKDRDPHLVTGVPEHRVLASLFD